MKTIAFVCPYFGSLDLMQFQLWSQSCAENPSIDFLLFLDDKSVFKLTVPQNIKLYKMSWEECKNLIGRTIKYNVSLVYPYKLCDLKPAYGQIFSEYLHGYDFWGHLDMTDTILGNLRKFINDDLLETYDKVHSFGHMTLYRNSLECNERFLIPPKCGVTVAELFARDEVTGFDEMDHPWSINTIYKENGFSLLPRIPNLVDDILPHDWNFALAEDKGEWKPRAYEYNNGSLYEVTIANEQLHYREIGYIHFQKRRIKIEDGINKNHYYIIPNEALSSFEMYPELLKEVSRKRIYLEPAKARFKRFLWYVRRPKVFIRKIRERLVRISA